MVLFRFFQINRLILMRLLKTFLSSVLLLKIVFNILPKTWKKQQNCFLMIVNYRRCTCRQKAPHWLLKQGFNYIMLARFIMGILISLIGCVLMVLTLLTKVPTHLNGEWLPLPLSGSSIWADTH